LAQELQELPPSLRSLLPVNLSPEKSLVNDTLLKPTQTKGSGKATMNADHVHRN
jgi:hypothetical protein